MHRTIYLAQKDRRQEKGNVRRKEGKSEEMRKEKSRKISTSVHIFASLP